MVAWLLATSSSPLLRTYYYCYCGSQAGSNNTCSHLVCMASLHWLRWNRLEHRDRYRTNDSELSCNTILYTTLNYIILKYIALGSIGLDCVSLHYVALDWIALHCIILNYMAT